MLGAAADGHQLGVVTIRETRMDGGVWGQSEEGEGQKFTRAEWRSIMELQKRIRRI